MRLPIVITMIFILYTVGCSSGKSQVSPLDSSFSDLTKLSKSSDNMGILGNYRLTIDLSNLETELTPKRTSSLGESWIVSGESYFTSFFCSNCLRMKGISLTTDFKIKVWFYIEHPFEKGDPLKPPTGRNRLDLDIFDTAMIVVPLNIIPSNYPQMERSIYSEPISNVDGYTRELANLIQNESSMPYILIVDDSDESSLTFNRFGMGTSHDFDIVFNLENNSPIEFDLYLTFGYGASATFKTRLAPIYFNPEFNRKSAWKVVAIPPESENPPQYGNTWQEDDTSTEFEVTVKVYDWQQNVTAISNPPAQPGDIAFSSNVANVSVEIPGMTSSFKTVTSIIDGIGTPDDPLIFKIPVANEMNLSEGKYTGLVKVTDERIPSASIPDIDQLIHSDDAINRANYLIPEFATYQTFTATVLASSLDPNAHMWTITWGGTMNTFPNDVLTDINGNIYVCGQYQGTVDFDPDDTGVVERISNGEWDIFLSKFDSSGDLLWVKVWGGIEWDYGSCLALKNNTVYIAGSFENSVDFDPGTGDDVRVSNGYMDAFLSKFDTDGNFQWVKTWGGDRFEYCYGMDTDISGNIALAGWYELTVDFDPGLGEDIHIAEGMHDAWFSKFDSNGNHLWTDTIGSIQADWASGLDFDDSGNVIVTGQFRNVADFNPDPLDEVNHTSNGGLDVFLAKYDPSGEYIWSLSWGGGFWDYGNDLAQDSNGNIYVAGQFQDALGQPIDFDPGTGEDWHTPNGYTDSFLSKFKPDSSFEWALTWGGLESDGCNDVAVTPSNRIFVTGDFVGNVDFDPGAGTDWHSAASVDRFDAFLSRFNTDGEFQWCGTFGGDENDFGIALKSDNSSNVYITGRFALTVDFDPGSGIDNHTAVGDQDTYLTKIDS